MKYRFACSDDCCCNDDESVMFTSSDFISTDIALNDYLQYVEWTVDERGMCHMTEDTFPVELSRDYFINLAYIFASKLLENKTQLLCQACGELIVAYTVPGDAQV